MISARRSTTRTRSLAAMLLATGIAVSLAACGSEPGDGCSPVPPGDASDLVSAEGSFGAKPTVDFPTPLVATEQQATVLDTGDGEFLDDGDSADFEISVWDGASGAFLLGTNFSESRPSRGYVGGSAGFGELLQCAQEGSRIVAASTFDELLPGQDPLNFGVESTDSTLVAVIDVVRRIPQKADGDDRMPQAGFPSVVTAPNGTPGVTIPNEAPPTRLESTVLKGGDGDVVEEGDIIAVQYEGLTWGPPGAVFQNTWTDSVPQNFLASEYDPNTAGSLFPGTADAIIGARVGSQVMIVVPPEFSYPADAPATDGVEAGETRIYVVDILAVID